MYCSLLEIEFNRVGLLIGFIYKKYTQEEALRELVNCMQGIPCDIIYDRFEAVQGFMHRPFINPVATHPEPISFHPRNPETVKPSPLRIEQSRQIANKAPSFRPPCEPLSAEDVSQATIKTRDVKNKSYGKTQRPRKIVQIKKLSIQALQSMINDESVKCDNAKSSKNRSKHSSRIARYTAQIKELRFQQNIEAFNLKKQSVSKFKNSLVPSQEINDLSSIITTLNEQNVSLTKQRNPSYSRTKKNAISARISRNKKKMVLHSRELVNLKYQKLMHDGFICEDRATHSPPSKPSSKR
jgi:hypothetical protein